MSNPQIDNAPGKSKPELADRTERVAREIRELLTDTPQEEPIMVAMSHDEATELLSILDGDAEPVNVERLAIAINYAGISPRQASEVRKKLSYDGTGTLADVRAAWNLPDGHVMRTPDVTKNEYRDAARAILAYAQEANDA